MAGPNHTRRIPTRCHLSPRPRVRRRHPRVRTLSPRRPRSAGVSPPGRRFADVRLIHTSDWHLGRTFHRVGLHDAQARFLDHLVEVVTAERVDVVLVAGDVYDRALPAVDTVALLDDALVRLRAAGAQVILSSGNHDSAQRLGLRRRACWPPAACTCAPTRRGSRSRCCSRTSTARSRSTRSPTSSPSLVGAALGPAARPAGDPPERPDPRPWTGSGPTWPSRPARHALGRGGPRLRRRRRRERLRARHQRRRGGGGADRRLRRRRLRRARPPARADDARRDRALLRLADRLLLLRGRPDQGLLAGRPRRRRASAGSTSSRRRSPARWRSCAGRSRSCWPTRPTRRRSRRTAR